MKYCNGNILIYLFFTCALYIIAGSCSNTKSTIEKSGEWDRISDGEYMIENCTWNVQAATGEWSQTIFSDTIKGIYGWRWDFSNEKEETNYICKTFPEIIFGKKPFDVYESTTSRLPARLDSANFRLEYEYIAKATGTYNTTTDLSFTDTSNPSQENIRAKMMIWFDSQNMPFHKSENCIDAVIGGRKHKVFINKDHTGPEGKWVFIAMMPEDFPAKGEINFNEYFEYAVTRGALKPEWYLSSIEAGSEIATGKGEITFKRFIVH